MLERTPFGDGAAALVSSAMAAAGFLVAFTERTGGASEGPFRSLNVGFRTGDHPGRVAENRRRLCGGLGIDRFAVCRQVHGAGHLRIGRRRAGLGFEGPGAGLPPADVLTTALPGVAVAVLVADCVPLALVDPGTGRVAAVHAGWRGLAAGVVQAAVSLFEDPRRLRAAIGPAIGPDHYEVGPEVLEAVRAGTGGEAAGRVRGRRTLLDLPRTVHRVLRGLGVRSVERAEVCTACEPDRFFSHRRDGLTGRQAMVAVRLP